MATKPNNIKSVRRAQTISPFGAGAILDIRNESLIATDISYWRRRGNPISEPRLQKLLKVNRLVMAPAAPEGFSQRYDPVTYFRFPRWVFCSKCRRMEFLLRERPNPDDIPLCPSCNEPMTPMRFVLACPRGHLEDVPWYQWAHSLNNGRRKCERRDTLSFITLPGGSGLEFIQVRCKSCEAWRSLDGIASPDSMKALGHKCGGRQPWQKAANAIACDAVPQVLQRGATNLTFPIVESSIDIPPYSSWTSYSDARLQITETPEYMVIRSNPGSVLFDGLIAAIATKLSLPEDVVRLNVNLELEEQGLAPSAGAADAIGQTATEALLPAEYQAFIQPDGQYSPRDNFIKQTEDLRSYITGLTSSPETGFASLLDEVLDKVVRVTRLREVRVLTGFSRLGPAVRGSGDDDEPGVFSIYGSRQKIAPVAVPADLGTKRPGERELPAIEVFGEGVFLSFKEDKVRAWESRSDVRTRVTSLVGRHESSTSYMPFPTPRFVMLHTLAHILIRQLSFECGYSTASLRERVYATTAGADGTPMAGVLIYTAAGDSEGTLGGLVREGNPDRLIPTMSKALQTADWCSSDPLCRESRGQGLGAMNLAACHGCALLPETSCIYSNRELDRVLLLGNPEDRRLGFLGGLLDALLKSNSSA